MDTQIEEFMYLWHQIMQIDQDDELKEKYPLLTKLTVNEISVIDIVASNPHVILKDICQTLNLPKSTLTNVINTFDKKGYLHRTIAKQDFRSYGLKLTEKGVQAQKEHLAYETETCHKVLDSLDAEERSQLFSIVKKILRAYGLDNTNTKDSH